MRCQRVVVEGPELGRAVALDAPRTMGTASGNDLVLTDERVSGEVHRQYDGNVSAGARSAGVDRKHWRTLLRKHGLIADGEEG